MKISYNKEQIIASVLLLFLGGCAKDAIVPDDSSRVTPPETAIDLEVTADGTRYILPEPVTLTVGVSPMSEEDGAKLRAEVGDFDGAYSADERAKATVNTFESDLPKRREPPYKWYTPEFFEWRDNNREEYEKLLRDREIWMKTIYKLSALWGNLGGYDWVRDITIPELQPSDYTVTGVIPLSDEDFKARRFDPGEASLEPNKANYKTVTISLFKLPVKGTLTFLVNSRAYQQRADAALLPLTLDNPFFLSENPRYQLTQDVLKGYDFTSNGKNTIGGGDMLFESRYLPMYTRLTDVAPTQDKKGIIGRESGSKAAPAKVDQIYLERAVARVLVGWEYSYVPEGGSAKVTPVDDHFFDEVEPGKYVSVTSIVPNNWTALLTAYNQMHSFQAKFPFLREGNNTDGVSNEDADNALATSGSKYFYLPENFPVKPEDQSTMNVYITRFNPSTREITDRRYKYFPMTIGTKVGQLRQIRRNHSYEITLRFKQTPSGVVPYIVDTWEDQPVDIPW